MDALWEDYSKFIIDVQRKTNKKFLLKDPLVPPGEEDKIAGKFQETYFFLVSILSIFSRSSLSLVSCNFHQY